VELHQVAGMTESEMSACSLFRSNGLRTEFMQD
jgi:hypothetical protein